MCLQKFQLISPNIAVQEQKETQGAAQQAEIQLQNEQSIPLEEEIID